MLYSEQCIEIIMKNTGLNLGNAKMVYSYVKANFTKNERDFETLQLFKKDKVVKQLKELSAKVFTNEKKMSEIIDIIRVTLKVREIMEVGEEE